MHSANKIIQVLFGVDVIKKIIAIIGLIFLFTVLHMVFSALAVGAIVYAYFKQIELHLDETYYLVGVLILVFRMALPGFVIGLLVSGRNIRELSWKYVMVVSVCCSLSLLLLDIGLLWGQLGLLGEILGQDVSKFMRLDFVRLMLLGVIYWVVIGFGVGLAVHFRKILFKKRVKQIACLTL
ncbi:hypothetical protein [Pseudovibrio sp. Tun.PSC04-5.I4]|uniref:hypothetical protein n=1 Tax=Pseudovibrio sp. Tun.PSC04-5.I4 TaxID=1798213 RepID=UPI00117B8FC0|nr:hypothetical protein [Pseudovibrio sp. Tun.PSC04-5.I4]